MEKGKFTLASPGYTSPKISVEAILSEGGFASSQSWYEDESDGSDVVWGYDSSDQTWG